MNRRDKSGLDHGPLPIGGSRASVSGCRFEAGAVVVCRDLGLRRPFASFAAAFSFARDLSLPAARIGLGAAWEFDRVMRRLVYD